MLTIYRWNEYYERAFEEIILIIILLMINLVRLPKRDCSDEEFVGHRCSLSALLRFLAIEIQGDRKWSATLYISIYNQVIGVRVCGLNGNAHDGIFLFFSSIVTFFKFEIKTINGDGHKENREKVSKTQSKQLWSVYWHKQWQSIYFVQFTNHNFIELYFSRTFDYFILFSVLWSITPSIVKIWNYFFYLLNKCFQYGKPSQSKPYTCTSITWFCIEFLNVPVNLYLSYNFIWKLWR